jgi:DNA-binding IclR family transcriptional regulator
MPAAPQDAGPRAVLRVPEILLALASRRSATLAELCQVLDVPKTSLHRLLRTLEGGGYLTYRDGSYALGPSSLHLSRMIDAAAPSAGFPANARPVLEGLARETGETIMLGVLAEGGDEIVYVDVIDSTAPVRFTVPIGDRRPLYSAASGKAVLAFLPKAKREAYVERCEFVPFTPLTVRREALPEQLREAAEQAVAVDDGGKIVGAAGIASPVFGSRGDVFASVSVAGPAHRVLASRSEFGRMVRAAGAQISRIVGFNGEYPPRVR